MRNKTRIGVCGILAAALAGMMVLSACKGVSEEHTHTLVETPARQATCTTDGNKRYWTCTECGKLFADPDANNETAAEQVRIPAAHKLEKVEECPATCTEGGNIAYWTCSVCNLKFSDAEGKNQAGDVSTEKLGHQMEEHLQVEPQVGAAGSIHYYSCLRCQKNFRDELGEEPLGDEELAIPAIGEFSFEAENAVLEGGCAGALGNTKTDGSYGDKTGEGYVENTNGNGGASILFHVNADRDIEAKLIAVLSCNSSGEAVTDVFAVTVNGTPFTSDAKIPYVESVAWREFADAELGTITLREGVNTILFTVRSSREGCVNFNKIKLQAQSAGLTEPHVCKHVCKVCGKCLDSECLDPFCVSNRCGHATESYDFLAAEATLTAGTKGDLKTEKGYVENTNNNTGAKITFKVTVADDTAVRLYAYVSKREVTDNRFTDFMTINVNGETHTADAFAPYRAKGPQWSNFDVGADLGLINLTAGENTIEFTVNDTSGMEPSDRGFNFQKIALWSHCEVTKSE